MLPLTGKNVVVIGGSRGVGRQVVQSTIRNGARVLAVARQEGPLRQLAEEVPGTEILALDAADEGAPAKVFDVLTPHILVVCAGAFPPAAVLHKLSWQDFAVNWNADVKDRFSLPQSGAVAAAATRRLRRSDRERGRPRRLAEFRRLCRSQAHADIHGELQSEGIGSARTRSAIHRACTAHDAGHRARQACGHGLFALSGHIRG